MSYTTYLAHHGIKGQKWGVRRYQNEDGSLTSAGVKRLRKKSKKYDRKAKIVSKIVSTLSDDEYMLLNPGISKKTISSLGRDYFNKSAGEANSYTAKRIIIRDKKLQPASYLDAHLVPRYGEKPTLNISVATANNNGTRGKGYADKAVKKMLKWHAKNKKLFGDVEWDVAPNNVASRRLAEKNGFEYAYTDSDNGWVRYIHHSALSHHGIKGQKWGVRRFQNPDGTLTTRGKNRRSKHGRNTLDRLSKAKSSNLEKWGKSPEHNALYITGLSGSGKSTVATFLQKNNNADYINLDSYFSTDKLMSKAGLPYKYGNNTAELYDWNYEWTASKEVSHSVIVNDDIYSYRSYLAHHGIKGQKWGVRRFQNLDGSLTSDGRHRQRLRRRIISRDKTNPEINDLVRAMTDEDKARIGLNKGQEYTNHDESVDIAHRSVLRRGKKIVAFCDAFMAEADLGQYGKNPLYVAIGTSAEQQNRGKGYATIVAKQMQKWFDSQDEFDVVVWSAKRDNVASRKIAEKLNFKYIPESASDTWVDYAYSKKREVSHSVIVNDDIYSYRSYLAHHGIKGQKWGVRRFQKADGSLTAAGAKRYGIKGAMSAGRKVGSGLVKAARSGIQKAKEVKARKAAEKLERQKKVWAKTRLGLTMNADKFSIEELREANNRLDERDRAARGLAAQVERGVGYFKAIRDVTGAIKDTKDYIEDISGEKGKKAKAADELKYQRELEKEKRTYERDMVRDKVKADQEYEYKREKDRLDRESKEKIEKMKAKAKKKKDSGGSDPDPEPDEAPKKKASRENTTEFEDVYWNSPKKDREFMETLFPKEVDEAKERKKRRNKARREVDEAIRRMGFFGHSDISTYGGMMSTTVLTASDISAYESYLAHHGIKGQKWGVRRFQNEDGSPTEKGLKRQARRFTRELNRNDKRMASSRAASMMQRRKLDKNSQQIEKATFNGNTRKVAKLEAKRAKIEAKKAKYDAKTKTVNDRQKAIGEACKNLNLDIASKTVNRSGRSRAGKVGVIALGMLTGVISTKSVNGTKYKVRSDPKVRRNGTVRDYSHGENRLTTGLGVLNFKSGNKRYRGGVRGTTRWND